MDIPRPKKIVWIVVDSLRADHLGCYGYKLNTSPNIDILARDGLVFSYAFSSISYTVPSVTSMFTSKYPSSHSVGFNHKFAVFNSDSDITIAEVLNSEGYKTIAIVPPVVMRKDIGLNAGFDVYDAGIGRSSRKTRWGDAINRIFFKWLDANHHEDFFSYIHYFDVHLPYIPSGAWKGEFVGEEFYGEATHLKPVVDGWGEDEAPPELGGIPTCSLLKRDRESDSHETDSRYYIAEYDACIRSVDCHISAVIGELKDHGIYDDTLVIITSDHGEAMGENDVWFYHGLTVTNDQIHVPLIIKPHKGWELPPSRIDSQVSLIDVMPTILELAGIDYDDMGLEGISLSGLISGGTDEVIEKRKVLAQIEGQEAVIDKENITTHPRDFDKDKAVHFFVEELCEAESVYAYRSVKPVIQQKQDDQVIDELNRDLCAKCRVIAEQRLAMTECENELKQLKKPFQMLRRLERFFRLKFRDPIKNALNGKRDRHGDQA